MKKLLVILISLFGITIFSSMGIVSASTTSYDPSMMLLSITDVQIANDIAGSDEELFVETLAQIGYDNYISGSSSAVEGMYEIFGYSLTSDEVALLLFNPGAAPFWLYTAQTALSTTPTFYPGDDSKDGHIGNSFQHAYWNVLMVKYIGISLAEAFATAHEERPNNPWIHKSMDLYNNEKGRDFADNISWIIFKSDATLATMTQDLVDNGELKYILFDYEYISAYIYYDGGIIEPVYDTGNFHAYSDGTIPIYLPEIEIIDRRTKPGPIIMPLSILPIEEEGILDVEEGTTE